MNDTWVSTFDIVFGPASFREAAARLGLVENDEEWSQLFAEAAPFRTAHVLRQVFVSILMEEVADGLVLWNCFAANFSDDLITKANSLPRRRQLPAHVIPEQDYALFLIDKKLRYSSRSVSNFGLPRRWLSEKVPVAETA